MPRARRAGALRLAGGGPLFALAAGALAAGIFLPAWGAMWALAAAIYSGFKWWTLRDAIEAGVRGTPVRLAGYLFLWPGMNAREFLPPDGRPFPAIAPLRPALNIVLGAGLVWVVARRVPGPLAAGWVGMIGLILMLHFGSFALLALGWQRLGARAQPLMRQPLLAVSPGEFWGRRWNTAFSDLVSQLFQRPLRARFGPRGATVCIFVFSGVVHDLVISWPARGGYGLPTLYFACQGAGILAEHSRLAGRLGLRAGWRGRLFTWAVVGGPVFLLFHPPFVRRVIVPFLRAIGAAE